MKKLFVLLFLFVLSTTFSQTTLAPGVYKSNVKGQNIMLKVFDDNKYEMTFLYGKFTVEKDTIDFVTKSPEGSNFSIKVDKDADFSSTLKIKFMTPYLMYAGRNIYLGTQKDENSMVEYKPIYDYIKDKENTNVRRKKELSISVDKTKYLYFVENRLNEATISKFQISPETNAIDVEYEAMSFATINLKGVVDPETKKLSIMEGTRPKVLFTFEKEGAEEIKTDNIKPVAVQTDKEWLKNNGFVEEENTEYFGERETSTYTFKYTNFKSYEEALNNTAKTDSKFLVIAFDNGKNAKKRYDDFIKTAGEDMSIYMRRGYNSKKDHFNFYLASEKDKSLLDKFKIKDNPTLLFVNSSGELLYHTKGTLEENADKFNSYYSVYDALKKADSKWKLDKILSNKKASFTGVKKAFFEITKTKGNVYSQDVPVADTTAVYVQEDYDADTVDSTAVATIDEDYYHVEDTENLYSFKAKKMVVEQKWKEIVDFYTKDNLYDAEFVEIAKKEIIGNGFTAKLFDEESTNYESDFKILDYILKNYDQISKADNKVVDFNENDDLGYLNDVDPSNIGISRVMRLFFSKRLSSTSNVGADAKTKYINYNKLFLKLSGYNLSDFKIYIEKIGEDNPADKSVYFAEYDDFFQTINAKSSSIIETLDAMFASENNSFMDWSDFKQSYSGLANTVAWDVVESKTKDANLIQKAIQWSESSLKIDSKSPYYLDTLGQLYYMNNQKDKAIATEQKAIDSITDNDKEQLKTYTDVLDKMKNGTY